jgi:ATP-dependent Lon protease
LGYSEGERELFTDHFGLVSDVLAEAFTRLRDRSYAGALTGRVHFWRSAIRADQNAVTKTVSGLLKLIQPDGKAVISDEDLASTGA